MKKHKFGLYVGMAMTVFVAFGMNVFAEGDANHRQFLSVKKVIDQRQESEGGVTVGPTVKELSDRFTIELDDNIIERKVSRVEEPLDGFYTQLLGVVGEDTTFRVTYTYLDGNKVDVIRGVKAWANGEYPEIDFTPPVKFGDDNGAKNTFRIGLEVYDDPDPDFNGVVRDALLGIGVISTSEGLECVGD